MGHFFTRSLFLSIFCCAGFHPVGWRKGGGPACCGPPAAGADDPHSIEAIAIRIATNNSNTAIDFLLMKFHSPFLIDSLS